MDALPSTAVLFDNAPCGLLLTHVDGRIQHVNATFCRWLGYAAEELVNGLRVQDLLTVGGRVFHQTHLAPLLQMQGSLAEVKLEMRRMDGERLPMLLNAISRMHGDVRYHELSLMIVLDRHKYEAELLGARKKAEEALASNAAAQKALSSSRDELHRANETLSQADRKKDEFLATLAHELRNPLAPMRNVVEILKTRTNGDPQLDWGVDVIQRQVSHMTHLVDDLMEVSRITQGKLELRKTRVELAEVMRTAIEAAQPLIQAFSHRLKVIFPTQPIPLDADPIRLTQVLSNLLTNAAKYTPPGGEILFQAQHKKNAIIVSVRDSGIGIPKEHLASVFDMFSQLSPALDRAQGGLGIGLALVRGLVKLHGGSVSAHSEGAGHGSEFTVTLPFAPLPLASQDEEGTTKTNTAPQATTDAAPNARDTRRRILVVDDNRDAAESLTFLLTLQGHDVHMVHEGEGALSAVADMAPHIVLLDIGLPGLNGYEIARRIRSESAHAAPVLIAITGWGQKQDKENALEAGFDFHLTKPIDHAELTQLILGT